MIDWYLVSVIVFVVLIALVVYRDRKNFTRESILLIRKTKRGRSSIIKLGRGFPRGWKALGVIAVISCFIASAFVFVWLVQNTVNILTAERAAPGLAFLIPSPTASSSMGPGYLAVPFWYWIISIALLVLVHEGLHGIMAARERIKIKSLGYGLLAILPLAFVEPDEKQMAKEKSWKQLRVFAAGSFANFMLAGLCLLVLIYPFAGLFQSTGVAYQGLIAGYPAVGANLTGKIVGIDDYLIRDTADLSDALERIGPNKTITILTSNGTADMGFTLTTAAEPTPLFRPDIYTDTLITLEHIFPGAVDFPERFSVWLSSLLGAEATEDWAHIQMKIQFWEYVAENYPALEYGAEKRIAALQIRLLGYPRSGFIGIAAVYNAAEIRPGLEPYSEAVYFSQGLLFFLFIINFGVGLANLLPIRPLDGGRMWELVFRKVAPKRYRGIINNLSYLTLLLLILNFVLPFI